MSDLLRSFRKIEPRQFSLDTLLFQRCLQCSDATSQILKLCQQPLQRFDFSRGQLTHAFKGLLKGFHPLLQFTHFLRRSFASLGESRVALGARPATTLTPRAPSRNIQMETAMSGTRRLIPERAEVISAYRMVTNPEIYANEPELHEKMQHAWRVLLADRRMRIEAKRAAQAIRSIFPGDAA
jgi:hypothetical protein